MSCPDPIEPLHRQYLEEEAKRPQFIRAVCECLPLNHEKGWRGLRVTRVPVLVTELEEPLPGAAIDPGDGKPLIVGRVILVGSHFAVETGRSYVVMLDESRPEWIRVYPSRKT